METLLVDTDVLSFLLKNDTRAPLYQKHLDGKRLAICFVTVRELYRWAITRSWSPRRIDGLKDHLRRFLVIPYNDEMAWEWAEIMSIKGHPIGASDAWIAAAALRHRIPLVTHNRRHFRHVPSLVLISES